MQRLLNAFRNMVPVRMSLDTQGWWRSVPAQGGWYFIETNTPLEVLSGLPAPQAGENHYNIPERIQTNSWVLGNGIGIGSGDGAARYVVYSGEQSNLMARAREHTHGHAQTECLRLSGYPQIHEYEGYFGYVTCESMFPGCADDKTLRVAGEQAWRASFGWPVLCKE